MEGGLTPVTHYGRRDFPSMFAAMSRLRRAIREEGNKRVQDAWDDVEPFIDATFKREGT